MNSFCTSLTRVVETHNYPAKRKILSHQPKIKDGQCLNTNISCITLIVAGFEPAAFSVHKCVNCKGNMITTTPHDLVKVIRVLLQYLANSLQNGQHDKQ